MNRVSNPKTSPDSPERVEIDAQAINRVTSAAELDAIARRLEAVAYALAGDIDRVAVASLFLAARSVERLGRALDVRNEGWQAPAVETPWACPDRLSF